MVDLKEDLTTDDYVAVRRKTGAHRHEDKWTDQHEKVLVEKWNAGVPASLIASHLTSIGYPSTKNTIIGRANRLRLGGAAVKRTGRKPSVPRLVPVSADGCRFIEGTPRGLDLDYCNAPRVERSAYCAAHRALTTRKPGQIEA